MPPREPSWTPTADDVRRAALTRFSDAYGLPRDYADLHRASVAEPEAFWRLLHRHFDLPGDATVVREDDGTPRGRWFPGVQLNYAERLFRDRDPEDLAILHTTEGQPLGRWTWGRLRDETARVRSGLQALGVGPGDRVAAYLPNLPETIAACLATASLGAIWSSAALEFGVRAVVDRFRQIDPKVLLAADGYRYAGRTFPRGAEAEAIQAAVGGQLVRLGHLDGTGWPEGFGDPGAELDVVRVPFDAPLWVLYSSGTTGPPKPIVHAHGGMLLEHLKYAHLHLDARADDRVFWFTTTGWMMWNFLLGVLLTDAAIVLYDGAPEREALWELSSAAGTTVFGTSAGFLAGAAKAGDDPAATHDLKIRAVGSTGSPLSPDGFRWVYDRLGARTWLFSMSGGTDVCTAFLAGVPTLPVYEGELQGPALCADVQAWDPDGRPVVDEVGELVLAQPMPCWPVGFWNDDDGERYRAAYFSHFPAVWRHGDWVTMTSRGTAIVHGRSDATINRGGVRMGTAEIYAAIEAVDAVLEALVVDVVRDGEHWMPLFVVLREGAVLDGELTRLIARQVREHCSPRHVPDEVLAVPALPRTLSGKTIEVPIKRLLAGEDEQEVVQRDLLQDPAALEPFVRLARERRAA